MFRSIVMIALGLMLCLASAGSQAAPEKKDKADPKKAEREKLARLIRQLGSESPEEREAAARALEDIGWPAVDALRNAIASGDGDVVLRARILVKKIEKQAEAQRVLAPTTVKLAFKKKLVTDAVAELAKKSGYRIVITADTSELKKRRVTLDTEGEMPFWKAFDQLCLKGSLVESDSLKAVAPRPGVVPMPVPFPNPGFNPAKPELPPQVIVEDGNPVELPTHYAGALRIRALPADSLVVTSQRGGDKETLVILEVTAEPKVQWQQLESVKVRKATDEQGQALEQVKPPEPAKGPGGVPMPPRPPPPFPVGRMPGQAAGTPTYQVPIRFTLAEKPSKVLKELSGVLAAKFQTPTQTLITVTDVLEATNKKYKGETGGAIEVLEIQAEKKGEVKVRLVLEVPPDVVEANAPAGMPGPGVPPIPVPMPGVGPGAAPAAKDTFGISLLDSRGRKFHPVGASSKVAVNDGKPVKEYTLTFQPQAGQGKAAKLVYEAVRSVVVEVPFAFADVPVP